MAITDWPPNERPREKLLQYGSHTLSDAELLAIFLRTGCKGKSAVDLARDLLHDYGGLRALLEASRETFCQSKGLGDAKFAQLQAALEMTRRHLAEALSREHQLDSSQKTKQFLIAKLRNRRREIFAVLFLDSQNRLICYKELFKGSIDSAAIYPREVVVNALEQNAAAVILAHNHPSGNSTPSHSDYVTTDTLKNALKIVDIRVLDHIVVGDTETYSFAENGKM